MTRRQLLAALPCSLTALPAAPLPASTILERIRKETGVEWRANTVDTLKTGRPDTPITGIATTFLATYRVLEQAAARRLNFVITHEPTFYNHLDETKNLTSDPVYQAKRDLIERHSLCVFRFHDHWHLMRPDGIRTGMVEAMGWQPYDDGSRFRFPKTPALGALASDLKKRLRGSSIRVIGDPAQPIRTAALMPGAGGSAQQMALLAREDTDLLVIGETREWETVEYARDALQQGRRKALIILGHAISEEGGMEYCARWVKRFVPEVPVEFVAAGEPYWPPR